MPETIRFLTLSRSSFPDSLEFFARGGGARRRVLEMTFAAEVGVTAAGKLGCRRFEKWVLCWEHRKTHD